ncbi:MAG: MtrB/PioB family decaheme-associated outer membrane protein [Burkholderiales bacterium]|nr:MtrB/PioB family decaheme-associated outer membrane protein [Burkholderiales bacterium]
MRKIDRGAIALAQKPLAIAVALALGAPAALLAEPMLQVPLTRGADMTRYDSDYVELGGGYNSSDSFAFGEYSGLYQEGGFVIGNANVRKRFGADGLGYINAWGYNLGLPSRQLGAEGGQQGLYWLNIGFDQLTRYQFDDTKFIHTGLGGNRLLLPAGFTGITAGNAQPPANAAAINPFLQTFEIEQNRDVLGLGGGFYLGREWKISVNYRQDNREGTKLIGSVMGSNGGNPRAASLPYELNDETQQVEVTASWTGRQGQLNLSYWYSKYSNDAASLTWRNPFGTGPAGWLAGTAFPTGFGQLGLMPDNDFHQLQATGAWNFTPSTRLTSTLAYSIMKQNDSFLPYTINTPAVTGTANIATPVPLPRGSLDGEIKNTLFDLSLLTRPVTPLSLRLNYQYRKHDNDTPSDVYAYVGGDVAAQPTAAQVAAGANNAAIRRNLPPGTEENKFKVDGDYKITQRTLLRGWYQYSKVNYEEAADELRSDTTNNLFGIELRRVMSETWTGALRYVYDQRRGSDFSVTRPYAASYTPGTVAASPVDNVTTLRQFFMADYNKNLIGATATINPLEQVSLGLRADYYEVDYKGPDCGGPNDQVNTLPAYPNVPFPADCLGRTKADGGSFTLDGTWMPAEGWNLFAFYTYQQYKTDQASRSWGGANAPQNANRDWAVGLDYSDNTFGLGLNFKPADKKYDVGMLYIFSDGKGVYSPSVASVSATPALGLPAPVSVPDTTTRQNSLQLFAKYQYSKNLLFRFNYWYQNLKTNDWAYDNAAATSSNNVLLTGHQSPRYDANVFGFSVAYTGW